MNTQQIIDFFGGTQQAAADALGVGQSDVAKWLKKGYPPYLRQLQAQLVTKGKLKAGPKPPPRKTRSDAGTKIAVEV